MRLRSLILTLLLALLALGLPLDDVSADSGDKPKAASTKKAKKTKYARTDHTVSSGETVGEIAGTYGVKTDDIIRWNKLKSAHAIRAGQRLEIYTPASGSSSAEPSAKASSSVSGSSKSGGSSKSREHRSSYIVKKGDTLGKIAEKQGVTVKQLKKWNPSLRSAPHSLKVGQKVTVWVAGPATSSTSVGHAAKGKLVNGEKLPSSSGYYIRTPDRSYATNLTVTVLMDTTNKLMKKHSDAPKIVVGDLSKKGGGALKPHKSHQSGRDADLGYYHKGNRQLDNFTAMNRHNLDVEKTWDFVTLLIDSGKVDYIFIDYSIQRLLYEHARKRGVSESYLDKHLQYPKGKGASGAEIKHEPGHVNHMHVRFSCSSGDSGCH